MKQIIGYSGDTAIYEELATGIANRTYGTLRARGILSGQAQKDMYKVERFVLAGRRKHNNRNKINRLKALELSPYTCSVCADKMFSSVAERQLNIIGINPTCAKCIDKEALARELGAVKV